MHAVINNEEGSRVIEFPTVVRGWENCQELFVLAKAIAVFNNLVGSADEIKIIFFEKRMDDIVTEGITYPSLLIYVPTLKIWGIWPQHIT